MKDDRWEEMEKKSTFNTLDELFELNPQFVEEWIIENRARLTGLLIL